MAVFTHDCPHCGATKAAFGVAGQALHPDGRTWSCLGICPACFAPLLFVIDTTGSTIQTHHGPQACGANLAAMQNVRTLRAWPAKPAADVPLHVPDRVARAFKEGCDVLPLSPSSACAQFRKALEWGLKDLAPDVEAWKLEKRIDKLAAEGKLTNALKDWAHQLRIDGNEAVHGEEDPTREQAQAIEQLTRYVLTYIYTLPKSIELARAGQAE